MSYVTVFWRARRRARNDALGALDSDHARDNRAGPPHSFTNTRIIRMRCRGGPRDRRLASPLRGRHLLYRDRSASDLATSRTHSRPRPVAAHLGGPSSPWPERVRVVPWAQRCPAHSLFRVLDIRIFRQRLAGSPNHWVHRFLYPPAFCRFGRFISREKLPGTETDCEDA